MSRTGDFSKDTVDRLAKAVGYVCSWPSCNSPTIGPSDESPGDVSSTGMACHIVASATGKGAKRVDSSMSAQLRGAYENGIWMCYSHGKLVDTDENRFTIEVLQKWKRLAELRARIRHESGGRLDLEPTNLVDIDLVPNEFEIPGLGGENERIGDALHDSLVPMVWGSKLAAAVRDLVVELSRNALRHGGASKVEVQITPQHVAVRDDGRNFSIADLLASPKAAGGALAAKILKNQFGDRVFVSHRYERDTNLIVLGFIRKPGEIEKLTPCSFRVDHDTLNRIGPIVDVFDGCETVYVVLPRYMSISDALSVPEKIADIAAKRSLVFVVSRTSGGAQDIVLQSFPSAKIIEFDE